MINDNQMGLSFLNETLDINDHKIQKDELENFQNILNQYLDNLEKHKNQNEDSIVSDALKSLFETLGFKTQTKCKIKGNSEIDLVLTKNDKPEVIIEAKKPKSGDFFSPTNINCKSLHEAILYYCMLRERLNYSIKYIIITDFYKFYIFQAKEFERLFYKNPYFKSFFDNFNSDSSLYKGNTDEFYKEAKNILSNKNYIESFTKDSLFEKPSINGYFIDLHSSNDTKKLYKVFNRDFLLNEFNPNKSNELDEQFYKELLYILGLVEKEQKGKILILPSDETREKKGTLYYNIFNSLGSIYEDSNELESNLMNEKVLEILIIWINRILFLKLLESNLISFNDDEKLAFLNKEKIENYHTLNELFFKILAKKQEERDSNYSNLTYLPYLNSSLFIRDSAKELIFISELGDFELDYFKNTSIKGQDGKPKTGKCKWIFYLFEFLDAFDFGISKNDNEIINNKKLIDSSVLGLVFEKLNGYKEGSFYTPSFITNYMCKISLEKIILDKFNFKKPKFNFKSLEDIRDEIQNEIRNNRESKDKIKESYRNIFHSIRICDPSVGSGHFLVSALNEMIYSYSFLGLFDNGFYIELDNDEVIAKDIDSNKTIYYKRPNVEHNTNHKIQKELFEVKKKIIENSLFGVDINPNSVQICRLRLWIELLKNTYYNDLEDKNHHNLNTLPNIDINIKSGNSLINSFSIDSTIGLGSISTAIKGSFAQNLKQSILEYKKQVDLYKNALSNKDKIDKTIQSIKQQLKNNLIESDVRQKTLRANLANFVEVYGSDCFRQDEDFDLFIAKTTQRYTIRFQPTLEQEYPKEIDQKGQDLLSKIRDSYLELEALSKADTFEWRFEFPEVLDENGNFLGFDLVIGNPPYIRQEEIKELKPSLNKFRVFKGTSDIYTYFYEQGYNILSQNGILSFITSNKWTRAGYGEPLRKFLLENTKILNYIDLNNIKVFDKATVDTSIITFAKTKINKDYDIFYAMPDKKDLSNINFLDISKNSLSQDSFVFSSKDVLKLKQKIESKGTPLKDWDISINYGIKTGYNEAFIIDTNKKDEILNNCKDEDERKRTKELIKPILRGRDIKRYSYEWAGLWLIFIPWHFPNTENPKSMKENEKDLAYFYPSLYEHLSKHKNKLSSRNKDETGINYEWYCLQRWAANYYKDFAKQKIVYPETAQLNSFVIDELGMFLDKTTFFIKGDNLKFINGILSSKLLFWYIKIICSTLGIKGFSMSKIFIERLPIPKIDSTNKDLTLEIISLVDKILDLKRQDSTTDISSLESKINELVYKLYDLSKDEIQIIKDIEK